MLNKSLLDASCVYRTFASVSEAAFNKPLINAA